MIWVVKGRSEWRGEDIARNRYSASFERKRLSWPAERRFKDACRRLEITEPSYDRWRREYGGLKLDPAKRLQQLEKENTRFKKLLAEKELDLSILKEVAEGRLAFDQPGVIHSTSRKPFSCQPVRPPNASSMPS